MSAQIVPRVRSFFGRSNENRAGQDTPRRRSVRLTGASMRILEICIASAAIATALLIGSSR